MIHDTQHHIFAQEIPTEGASNEILALLAHLLNPASPRQTGSRKPSRKRGRPAELASDHLWLALFQTLLSPSRFFLASLWRRITWQGVEGFPLLSLTRTAVRKRLLTMGWQPLHALLRRVSHALVPWTQRCADESLAPFASGVFALDQSSLDAVSRTCPDVHDTPGGSPDLLVGKISGLFDVRRQQWVRVLLSHEINANEKRFAADLIADLTADSLLLADLGYFAFAWFDTLTSTGQWWVSRVREKTSFLLSHVFVEQEDLLDALVWLGAHRSDQAGHLVRLIQFTHEGQIYRYLTNVLDPQVLSVREIAVLYARRWDIELAFKLLKKQLGLRLWWSAHPTLVLCQLCAAFILAQIVHALHLRIAAEAGVDLFEVSLPVLVTLLVTAPLQRSKPLIPALLEKGVEQGLLRPSRRYQVVVPALLHPIRPAPPDLCLVRTSRYAGRSNKAKNEVVQVRPRFFTCFLI